MSCTIFATCSVSSTRSFALSALRRQLSEKTRNLHWVLVLCYDYGYDYSYHGLLTAFIAVVPTFARPTLLWISSHQQSGAAALRSAHAETVHFSQASVLSLLTNIIGPNLKPQRASAPEVISRVRPDHSLRRNVASSTCHLLLQGRH